MKYSLDTSALLDGYTRFYPPDIFPNLWNNINQIINRGELRATYMVMDELKRKDDAALAWAKKNDRIFIPVDEDIQKTVTQIMNSYPRLVAEGGQRNRADPFVIALARLHNLIVITAETKMGSENKPSIPYICHKMDITCINFMQFIREREWSF